VRGHLKEGRPYIQPQPEERFVCCKLGKRKRRYGLKDVRPVRQTEEFRGLATRTAKKRKLRHKNGRQGVFSLTPEIPNPIERDERVLKRDADMKGSTFRKREEVGGKKGAFHLKAEEAGVGVWR